MNFGVQLWWFIFNLLPVLQLILKFLDWRLIRSEPPFSFLFQIFSLLISQLLEVLSESSLNDRSCCIKNHFENFLTNDFFRIFIFLIFPSFFSLIFQFKNLQRYVKLEDFFCQSIFADDILRLAGCARLFLLWFRLWVAQVLVWLKILLCLHLERCHVLTTRLSFRCVLLGRRSFFGFTNPDLPLVFEFLLIYVEQIESQRRKWSMICFVLLIRLSMAD